MNSFSESEIQLYHNLGNHLNLFLDSMRKITVSFSMNDNTERKALFLNQKILLEECSLGAIFFIK